MNPEEDHLTELLAQRRQLQEEQREREEERWQMRMLHVRNALNCIFMLMAVAAMLGIWLAKTGAQRTVFYYVGIMAVVIKMAEVLMRTMKKPWKKK